MNQLSGKQKLVKKRRDLIVEAALSCFLENGFNQSGIRDIAKKAGISLGNLYNHFSGKNAVLAEIAKLETKELLPFLMMLDEAEDPAVTFMGFTEKYAAYAAQPEHMILSIEILGEAIRNPLITGLFLENRQKLIQALAGLLGRGAANGSFRKMQNPEGFSELVLDSIEGYALRCVFSEDKSNEGLIVLKQFLKNSIFSEILK